MDDMTDKEVIILLKSLMLNAEKAESKEEIIKDLKELIETQNRK